jgi:RNA polymerase subunit RPABC4/transcription elongation factor Spt4
MNIIAVCTQCGHLITTDELGPCRICGSKTMSPYGAGGIDAVVVGR